MKIIGERIFAKDAEGKLQSRIGTMFFRTPGLVTKRGVQIAMEKLSQLRSCEVHMTHMVTPGDQAGLRRLGCRYTSDPYYATNALFTGER